MTLLILLMGVILSTKTMANGTTVDFIGNKIVIIKEDEAKVIEVKQKDIDDGNTDKIIKEVLEAWRPN